MRLTNITDDYIAFKVKTTTAKMYMVWPNIGIVPPRLTCSIIVTRRAQSKAPPDMQCVDKFLVLSVVVKEITKRSDITNAMFKKDSGNVVNQVRLEAVCIQPPPPSSPAREGSEEGSSSCPSSSDWGNINFQDTGSILPHMTLQQLKDITNNFSNDWILGKGGFDVVYKGVLENGKTIAMKNLVQSISSSQQQFENEELQKWRNTLPKKSRYSPDEDCQQIKRCIQLGLICVNPERTKRPTMKKIIDILQGLENMKWYIHNELTNHESKADP